MTALSCGRCARAAQISPARWFQIRTFATVVYQKGQGSSTLRRWVFTEIADDYRQHVGQERVLYAICWGYFVVRREIASAVRCGEPRTLS